MIKSIALVICIIAQIPAVVSQTADSIARKQLRALEFQIGDAITAGDKKALDRLTHRNYVETFDNSTVTKADIMKSLSPSPGTSFEFPQLDVEVYGNAALVRGIGMWTVDTITRRKVYVRFTDMLLKENNSWKMVSSHATSIKAWQATTLKDEELVDSVIAMKCSDSSILRSLNFEESAFLRFKNATSSNLLIYWIDYEGKRDQKRSVGPGKSLDIPTYLTHPFVVVREDGSCQGIFMAVKKPGLVFLR